MPLPKREAAPPHSGRSVFSRPLQSVAQYSLQLHDPSSPLTKTTSTEVPVGQASAAGTGLHVPQMRSVPGEHLKTRIGDDIGTSPDKPVIGIQRARLLSRPYHTAREGRRIAG